MDDSVGITETLKADHEDYVEYFLFPNKKDSELEDFHQELSVHCQALIKNYIWHKEPFFLNLSSTPLSVYDHSKDKQNSSALETCKGYFYGKTHFGDNVEDEWFIVYILKELTRIFPGVVARVIDNDGEFLLIEAAEHLPNWAESDSKCRQRVYLYEGKVHLIPLNGLVSDQKLSQTPSMSNAVVLVRNNSSLTAASKHIQSCIDSRIGSYPEKMEKNFHFCNVMLPPLLAAVLEQKPALISAGVLAFCKRDPTNSKEVRLMKTFQPCDSLVKFYCKFTRYLYAMLMKEDFRPDSKSGWVFPQARSSEFKAHSLGAKITLGFEILVSEANKISRSDVTSNFDQNSPQWKRYLDSLEKTGYFKGHLQGSKPYQELLSGAQRFFTTSFPKKSELHSNTTKKSILEDTALHELRNLIKIIKVDTDRLKKEGESLPEDDDDSWLTVGPQDLENVLQENFHNALLNPHNMGSKLKDFMKNLSDYSGVEDGSSVSNPAATADDSDSQIDENEIINDSIDFRADDFVSALDKLLHDLGGPDKDFEASDDSYGSEEDEFDVDLEDIKKEYGFSKETKKFFGIMDDMDKELATTEVGKTFSSSPKQATSKATSANMAEVDEFDEELDLKPVDIDMNALANILESYNSQQGPTGPSTTLLQSVNSHSLKNDPSSKK